MNPQSTPSPTGFPLSNQDIADILEQIAVLLEAQEADYYRVRAYREASQTLRTLNRSLVELYQTEGKSGLTQLPQIGTSLSTSLEELIHTGELRLLNRLRGEVSPEDLFTTIPGIGEILAQHIHKTLGIETLEELELAAHDGRLEGVAGFGYAPLPLVASIPKANAGSLSYTRNEKAGGLRHCSPIPLVPMN
jgi:DNA polymerase/3'-5' exonuclease PolX